MTSLVLYDDARARRFEPFALSRPLAEVRAGAELIRRRWELASGSCVVHLIAAPHLAAFEELDAPPVLLQGELAAGVVLASSRCAIALDRVQSDADVWTCEGRIAAVRLGAQLDVAPLAHGTLALEELVPRSARAVEVQGWWIDDVWDLVRHLPTMLGVDIPVLARTLELAPPNAATTVGTHPLYIEAGATVEPLVVFDLTAGPVLVRRGATIAAFTRLVGPTVVGEGTTIMGGRIAAASIGDQCRVHGELSTTIFLGHANKSHDGFVGHSYLGRWVNLGAGTITSNLKNTYGTVALWTPEGIRPTGMQFLGTFFGDHSKTAIGTRLTTGSVIGAGANVFGVPMAPKVVAPFAWGAGPEQETFALDKFLGVAERVMARRHVALGARQRETLEAVYAERWRVE